VWRKPWMTVSPPSGTGPVVFSVGTQFVAGLPLAGATSGQILISTNGAENTVGPVAVTLTTALNGASASPGGSFDTPSDGVTGVTGSIAVTGWALDDIEVRAVRVMRDPVPGEGTALIFIGNAVFVEGARPDVAATLPTLPQNLRGGWGYLLLMSVGDGSHLCVLTQDTADIGQVGYEMALLVERVGRMIQAQARNLTGV